MCELLAVGWLVLVETESVFLTAASLAVRQAPTVLTAPIGGYISDRVSRSRMLAATSLYKAVIVALLASVALGGFDAVWPVLVLVAFSGIGGSFEIPATQGLITDIVSRRMVMNAVTLQSTGARAVGAIGGLVGGLVISSFGVPAALFGSSTVFLVGAVIIAKMPKRQRPGADSSRVAGPRIFLEAAKSLAILMRLPIVKTVLLSAIVVEIFGFTYNSVLPAVARDLLNVGADGLGALTLMSGFGALIGVAILTTLGDFRRKGLLLIGVITTFGITLVAFSSSSTFPLSLVLIMGVGAMASSFDAMQWTLLQRHVPDDMRGTAIGGWVFAIGFGWIGHLAMGAVAQAIGVQWAIAGAGGLVVLTGLIILAVSSKLRAA